MANNHTQFSFAVSLPSEAIKWVLEEAKAHDYYNEDNEEFVEDNFEPTCAEFTVEMVGGAEALIIFAEETGNPESVVKILQAALNKFDLDTIVGFHWAYTCSRMRLDEFGGGAVVFKKNSEKWMDTEFFIHDTINSWKEENRVAGKLGDETINNT